MKALIQRVSSAKVEVDNKIIGKINKGLLVFIAFEKLDEKTEVDKMIKKILPYRIFNDENNKMNLSIKDVNGEMLIISQFTLAADTKSGRRAGFSTAKSPIEAIQLYDYFIEQIKNTRLNIASGIFGADMQVSLTNNGPVTFLLSC